MKATMQNIDTIKIANEDLEKAKKFKVASQYLIPWINGRNFLFGCWTNFGWYKERLSDINKELKC